MTSYNEKIEDGFSRLIRPIVSNDDKTGSGNWYFPICDSDGHLQVDSLSALPAGTNIIGKVGIDQTTLGTTNGVVRVKGGLSSSGVKSADVAIKESAGAVYWLTVSDSAALSLELNDSTDNGGTDQWAIDIPADGYAHFIFDPPIEFSTGIYLDVSTATCKVTVGYI